MTDRYGIVPAGAPDGASYPVWVVRDRATGALVKALPTHPEPLRFHSYDNAQAWVRDNGTPAPGTEVER
ncbi:hypothetical protein J5Y04_24540 [Kitasatospora sp. RG8]|uniref:hypothetical protein n=1 Tax=Kitasatospora sp. RG8 TaxID=2820815 RepID=UPI001AE0ACF7|nr:hypothetical protein [Kitasatospora sp. RG8]MBP0452686.1 hypothetical protein [Kitasatospora sp. RG8]